MLSISAVSVGGGATNYYVEYAQEMGEAPGQFYDRTGELGLSGQVVTSEAMQNLFDGKTPDGSRALCKNAGRGHRPGWDLTYSAPKSVSIIWANASPEMRAKLEAAHEKAVKAGLDYMNEHAAYVRTGHGGKNLEKAKLVAAVFQHSSNRKEQPQLHSHATVFNVARTDNDLKWRTLESREFFRAKMASGAIYQAELAHQVQRLGLEVERMKDGTFQVKGVPLAVCLAQSGRSKEITDLLSQQGLTRETAPAHLKEYLALKTRTQKDHARIARDFDRWQGENAKAGFGPKEQEAIFQQLQGRTPSVRQVEQKELAEAKLKELTLADSTYDHHQLTRRIAVESIGRQGAQGIEATLQAAKRSANFVALGKDQDGRERYTTREMVQVEREIFETVRARQGEGLHQVDAKSVDDAILARPTIKAEQVKALRHIVEGRDGVSFIEGDAGTGKSYLMAAVREVYEKNGYTVHGVSFTRKAAQNLEQGSGIGSTSVDKLLYDYQRGKASLDRRSIVVLDEAGMLDSRKTRELVKIASDTGAKLVAVGDAKQIQPILAGQAFGSQVKEFGAERLSEIVRQRQAWEREAVRDLAEKSPESTRRALDAFDEKGQLKILSTRKAARAAMLDEWQKGARQGVEKAPLMIATTNAEVRRLNEGARERLKSEGRLDAGVVFPTADGKAEIARGERIIFTCNDSRRGVTNSMLATVEKVDAKERSLTVMTENGERLSFKPDDMNKFRYGYALTTHKSQGTTVDKALVMVDGRMMDREKFYVSVSRGREGNMIFADKPTIGQLRPEQKESLRGLTGEERAGLEHEHYKANLAKMVATSRQKDTTQDYLDKHAALSRDWNELAMKPQSLAEKFTAAYERLARSWNKQQEQLAQDLAKEPAYVKDVEKTQKVEKEQKIERGVSRGYGMGR